MAILGDFRQPQKKKKKVFGKKNKKKILHCFSWMKGGAP
jgi:hypothetical protein